MSAPTSADLVGDRVDFALTPAGPITVSPSSAVVGPGVEAGLMFLGAPLLAIDVGSSDVSLTSFGGIGFAPTTLTISDLDWVGQPGVVTGFTITNNDLGAGFDNSNVSTTADSVSILFDQAWAANDNVTITLTTQHVPEPSSLLLVGMIGTAFVIRRTGRGWRRRP